MMMSEKSGFLFTSIADIQARLANGSLTPTEVAQWAIDVVECLEPYVKAWVRFDAHQLMDHAKEVEAHLKFGQSLGSLTGIPVGIKDMMNTADFPTEMGSPLWQGFTPGNDARVLFYLKQAGALVPGKTVTAEFAVHTLDKTLNPHDPTRTPGTSSSGSAAAVAAGMVPVALGTQTAGSIVRPASFCGVYGCKPSFGLIPRTGMLKTTDSLDTVGFFVSHLVDMERVFDVVRVHGQNFPLSHAALRDEARQNKPPGKPWRIAFVKPHVWDDAHPYAQEAMTGWVESLKNIPDVEVVEADLPSETLDSHRIHATIYNKTLSYYFQEEFKKAELVSPVMNDLITQGQAISVEAYQQALKDQEAMAQVVDTWIQDFDAVVTLSTAGEAPLREDTERPDSALLWNMTYLPVISAPTFIGPTGLPFGLQLVARRYNDYKLFKVASYFNTHGLLPDGVNPVAKIVKNIVGSGQGVIPAEATMAVCNAGAHTDMDTRGGTR
ncbi:MAG: amidase [Vampirovibrio sp.]|nr:amidase [Vampirovibrio sp.]